VWSIGGIILMGRNQSPGEGGGGGVVGHTVIVLRMLCIYPSYDTILNYELPSVYVFENCIFNQPNFFAYPNILICCSHCRAGIASVEHCNEVVRE